MFRKLKKLYFKIYHLFKLLGLFFLVFSVIPIVKADTCSYVDLTSSTFTYNSRFNRYIPYPNLSHTTGTYTFFIDDDTSLSSYFSSKGLPNTLFFRLFLNSSNCDLSLTSCTQVTSSDTEPMAVIGSIGSGQESLLESIKSDFHINEGSIPCISSPTPTPSSSPLSDFISIFIDRFSYLSSSIFSNAFIFDFIVVIFSFCILELFFKIIHFKRGRKK